MNRFLELKDQAFEWCMTGGFHDRGDTRVQFGHGGVMDLPELLASFAWLLEQGAIKEHEKLV